jgi:hypothetical protein
MQTGPPRPPGEFMAANGCMPPTPKHSAWVAYAIIFPVLLLALVTSPIWVGAFGALKLITAFKRRVEIPVKIQDDAGALSSDRTGQINGTTILVPTCARGSSRLFAKERAKMRFRDALPLVPAAALVIFVGAYLLIDDAAEKPSRPAVPVQSYTGASLVAPPDAELATPLPQTVLTSPDNSTELTRLQQTVQALQSSNKSLSDQVNALAARLDNLEKAHAEISEPPRGRGRRR